MNGHSQWAGIRYFSPDSKIDNWGDTHQISGDLLLELDRLRQFIGVPIIITSAFRSASNGNEGGSQHNIGLAADIIAPSFKGSLLDLYFAASRFEFRGIGVYRDWEHAGKKVGGLHVDVRPADHRALWFCYKDAQDTQQYIALSLETLKGFGVV